MSLNKLYSEHQQLQMRADSESPGAAKSSHELEASLVAGRIGCIQRALGATAAQGWVNLAESSTADVEPVSGAELGHFSSDAPASLAPDPAQTQRRKAITSLAILLLGPERGREFLESPNALLGGRPLELATMTAEGRDRVETELGRMISHPRRGQA